MKAHDTIYAQVPAPKSLSGFDRWKGLRTIAMVAYLCIRNGKETTEVRYFISSLKMA